MVSFIIPYPKTAAAKRAWSREYGLNAYWSGKHWARRKADADFWHTLVRQELHRQGIAKQLAKEPVILTMYFNDRLDSINHAAMFKVIEDALKGHLIQDDSRRYVVGSEMYFHDRDCILVEVKEC